MRNLITIAELQRAELEAFLDRAETFAEVAGRRIKKVPALRGSTVVNLFYEASTRTSSSFELAAQRLSADVVTIRAAGSSVEKGESLKDTIRTLSAYDPSAIVIRHPNSGAPALVAGWTDAAVVNAGDGKHAHPTQALLDLFVLRRARGQLDGARVLVVGDIRHSRVARSLIRALTLAGATADVCAPATLVPVGIQELGVSATYQDLASAVAGGPYDAVYALRIQRERAEDGSIPSLESWVRRYQVTPEQLKALGARFLMHPGPVNRGVELSGAAIDAPGSLIEAQVRAGVAVRMAVLYELLATPAVADGAAGASEAAEGLEEMAVEA